MTDSTMVRPPLHQGPNSFVLEVRGLTKEYPVARRRLGERQRRPIRAVDDVSFDLRAGETLAIVGESGCGKSTIAKLLARLEVPTSGSVRFDGRDFSRLTRADRAYVARNVQIVFQDPFSSLDPRFTVERTVTEPWLVHPEGAPLRTDFTARAAELLSSVDLPNDLLGRRPAELSGGQLQRASIARAMALNPRVLICDEAVSALDLSAQAKVLNVLAGIQKTHGTALVFISHDLSVVRHIATRVAVMYFGKLVEYGTRDAVFSSPRHPYTAALLSAEPNPEFGTVRRHRVILSGELPDPSAPPSGCTFRTRCWRADDVCASRAPALLPDVPEGEHVRACYHPITAGEMSAE